MGPECKRNNNNNNDKNIGDNDNKRRSMLIKDQGSNPTLVSNEGIKSFSKDYGAVCRVKVQECNATQRVDYRWTVQPYKLISHDTRITGDISSIFEVR